MDNDNIELKRINDLIIDYLKVKYPQENYYTEYYYKDYIDTIATYYQKNNNIENEK